jgi:regulator of protease activity HflC (stomatin/prohibitin superfamily)
MNAKIDVTPRALNETGWRQGLPLEDPQKTKRWGFVTAKPSEYLVHVRSGAVRRRSSGQGSTCFKWPWDAVAIVPTSLQRLSFVADQVTLEKVGIQVAGLAVYRIAEPLIAYRVLNFSYPERAQQKLETTLGAMLVGATRRLVANLSVEECLRRRKAAIADELLREIAPVLGGRGSPDDTTATGWGVVLDTVEIQEVRVLSESVFAAMQAPYRAGLEQQAREARAEAERVIALGEAARERETAEARLQSEAAVRERRAEIERQEHERAAADALHRGELALRQIQAELAAHAVHAEAVARRAELASAELEAELARRRAVAEVSSLEARLAAEASLAEARVERERAEARARVVTAERLPDLAAAVGARFGEVKITHVGDGSPFGSIAQAIASVIEVARA